MFSIQTLMQSLSKFPWQFRPISRCVFRLYSLKHSIRKRRLPILGWAPGNHLSECQTQHQQSLEFTTINQGPSPIYELIALPSRQGARSLVGDSWISSAQDHCGISVPQLYGISEMISQHRWTKKSRGAFAVIWWGTSIFSWNYFSSILHIAARWNYVSGSILTSLTSWWHYSSHYISFFQPIFSNPPLDAYVSHSRIAHHCTLQLSQVYQHNLIFLQQIPAFSSHQLTSFALPNSFWHSNPLLSILFALTPAVHTLPQHSTSKFGSPSSNFRHPQTYS